MTSKYYVVDRDPASISESNLPTNKDMLVSLAVFTNDRRVVLRGLGTFQVFAFVWNILLEFEEKTFEYLHSTIKYRLLDILFGFFFFFFLQKFNHLSHLNKIFCNFV